MRSLVIMSAQKLICARDPFGFRPLCYGRTADGTYIVASESCALRAVGAKLIRDINPGEIMMFYNGQVKSIQTGLKEASSRGEAVSQRLTDEVYNNIHHYTFLINILQCNLLPIFEY